MKSEIRMTKVERNPKPEVQIELLLLHSSFVIRVAFVIRHSPFVIRDFALIA